MAQVDPPAQMLGYVIAVAIVFYTALAVVLVVVL